MDVKIAESWKNLLADEFEKPYFAQLVSFVHSEYATHRIFPRGSNIFRAFDKCPFDKLKVVIIGQDPYHGEGQANGLCFSVNPGVPFPPSLQNIFQEVSNDTGAPIPADGDLDRWAEQGVLLLSRSSPCVPTRPPRTPDTAGNSLPTPWSRPSTATSRISSTCSGAATPNAKEP